MFILTIYWYLVKAMKKIFESLSKIENIENIEKNIFYFYVIKNKIDYRKSIFLTRYFINFKKDLRILNTLSKIEHFSFKDLENALEQIIPNKDKKINGAFFTPEYIVDYIIKEINPDLTNNKKIVDLSCGCGAFLLGVLRYSYLKNLNLKKIVKNNLYGYDILKYNIDRTKILLALFCLEHNFILENTDFNLFSTDSLKHNFQEKFDYVIGNPPYVKFQDLSQKSRSFLKQYETAQKGNYNLYFPFFELGYKLLSDNGKIGFITPNNYFTSIAAEPLREFFHKTKSISKIIDFGNQLIFEVQAYTAITFMSKKENNEILFDKINHLQPEEFLKENNFDKISLDSLKFEKWKMIKKVDFENVKKIENSGIKLSSLFSINVGVATLKDVLYTVEDRLNKDYFIKTINDKQYKIESSILMKAYKVSDLKKQEDVEKYDKRMIFPYSLTNNKIQAIPEKTMKKDYPFCYEYLKAIKKELLLRSSKNLEYFYLYGKSQGLKNFGTKILTPTFSKYPNFIVSKDENSIFFNGYGLFLKENRELFISLPENIEAIQKILNSKIMDYYVNQISVSLQGGYPCYQKNFIENFSIPLLSQSELNDLKDMSEKEADAFLLKKYKLNLNF